MSKMIKKTCWLMTLIIFCFIVVAFSGCGHTQKYPTGKDTHESYGDGTYQIIVHSDRSYALTNVELQLALEKRIYKYKQINNKLYVFGSIGYTILFIDNLQIKQYITLEGYNDSDIKQYEKYYEPAFKKISGYTKLNSFNDFSDEERAIFTEMKTDNSSSN